MSIRIRNLRRWAFWLALVCATALALAAQTARAVKGVVRDQNGNPLRGAVVQLKDTRTLWIRSYISRKDGSYQFRGLQHNVDYELSAAYQHQSGRVKPLSRFDERPVAFIDLIVEVEQ